MCCALVRVLYSPQYTVYHPESTVCYPQYMVSYSNVLCITPNTLSFTPVYCVSPPIHCFLPQCTVCLPQYTVFSPSVLCVTPNTLFPTPSVVCAIPSILPHAGQLQESLKRPSPSTNLADTQRHMHQLDTQIRKDVEAQQQQQKVPHLPPPPLQWNLSIKDTVNKGHLSNEDAVCCPNHIELCTNVPLKLGTSFHTGQPAGSQWCPL